MQSWCDVSLSPDYLCGNESASGNLAFLSFPGNQVASATHWKSIQLAGIASAFFPLSATGRKLIWCGYQYSDVHSAVLPSWQSVEARSTFLPPGKYVYPFSAPAKPVQCSFHPIAVTDNQWIRIHINGNYSMKFRFEPASSPKLNFFPWLIISSTTGLIWFTLIGINNEVLEPDSHILQKPV